MCREYLTIALCAPQKAPKMSFTCGKLHLVVSKRETCDKATGKCLCFVGSCGLIQPVAPDEGIPLSSVQTLRCAPCTSREEEIGSRRTKEELINSPLLTRTAIKTPEEMQNFQAILKNLWDGKAQCPFHAPPSPSPSATKQEIESVEAANDHVSDIDVDSTTTTSTVTTPTEDKIDGNVSDESSSRSTSTSSNKAKQGSGLGRKVGIESSIWATAKEEAPKPKPKPKAKSPLQLRPLRRRGQKLETCAKRKTSAAVLPVMSAAKSFLGTAKDWEC